MNSLLAQWLLLFRLLCYFFLIFGVFKHWRVLGAQSLFLFFFFLSTYSFGDGFPNSFIHPSIYWLSIYQLSIFHISIFLSNIYPIYLAIDHSSINYLPILSIDHLINYLSVSSLFIYSILSIYLFRLGLILEIQTHLVSYPLNTFTWKSIRYLNTSKAKLPIPTRSLPPPPVIHLISINGNFILAASLLKNLAIISDSSLSLSQHPIHQQILSALPLE